MDNLKTSTCTDNFWQGFFKIAVMMKGERSDEATGAKPRTLVASKGRVNVTPLPSADEHSKKNQHLDPEIKLESIRTIRKVHSGRTL